MTRRVARIAALPDNQLCLICRHVFLGERPVAYLEPTAEGILVAACGEDDHGDGPSDWLSAGFATLAARDPGLRACPPVAVGEAGERDGPDAAWKVRALAADEGAGGEDDGEAG